MNPFSSRRFFALTISLVVWLGLLCCFAHATETTPRSAPTLRVTAGRLTAHLPGVPLSTALGLLARQSHVKLVLRAPAEDQVSVSFTDLPLEEGLARLLRGKSFTLIYAALATSTRERASSR